MANPPILPASTVQLIKKGLRREMIAIWARNAKLEILYEWASLFPGKERELNPAFKRRFR